MAGRGPYRRRVKTFDVAVGHLVFRVDAFDWRSGQTAAQKRYGDQTGARAPFVPKSAVAKVKG